MPNFLHKSVWLVLFGLAFLISCTEQDNVDPIALHGRTMGTTFSVKYYPSKQTAPSDILLTQINNKLLELNQALSTYIPDSELSIFNKLDAYRPIEASEHLSFMFDESIAISKESNRAFDVTIGPLVNLWGFGPNGRITSRPKSVDIQQTREWVGPESFEKTGNTVIKHHNNVYVDFSAIAKGYGADILAELLDSEHVKSYLVEVGGELKSRGIKPGGKHWTVAIEKPVTNARMVQAVLPIKDIAMATSGDYRNYFEEDGIRYSHTINSMTGAPIVHRLVSVTVFAKTSARADAYATAINVLGPEKGLIFADKYHLPVYMLVKSSEGFKELTSNAFEPYQQQLKKIN